LVAHFQSPRQNEPQSKEDLDEQQAQAVLEPPLLQDSAQVLAAP
jgi:hypothetical protein